MHKKKVGLTVLASLAIAGLNVSGPYIYGRLVSQASTLALSDWIIWVVIWSSISLIAIYIERFVNLKKNNLGLECNVDINIEQFEVKNKLPVIFHSTNNSGEVNERITKAGSYLNIVICDVIFTLLPDIFTLIVVAGVMFFKVSQTLSLIIMAVMLLYIIVTIRAAQKLTVYEKESRKRYKKAVGYMHDIGVNIFAVKAFCLENFVAEKLKSFFGDFKQLASLYLGKWADTDFYQKSILSLGSVCILSFAGFIMGQHVIDNGQLAMIMVYTSLVFKPFASLSNHYFMMKRAEVSIDDGEELLKEKVEPNIFDSAITREGDDKIEIRNVSYSYEKDSSNLKTDKKKAKGSMIKPIEAVTGLNFEFAPGARMYGIIGPSGCGKTTLMKLLVGFYLPTKGKILFDNIDIKHLASLRKIIVFVESTPLFDGTIEDNIRMDNSKATIIEVMEAAKAAGVHDDIIRRGGYAQSVGPSGLQLSKGEVARIIIARALLNSNDAEVVIFDEPTTNLDNRSIEVIKGTFERLAGYKKVIIVTHDINFVEKAEIIVMEKGRIIERGSLKEIIELGAVGAELFSSQNKNKSKE